MTQPSLKPTNWDGFFAARDAAEVPDDFLCPKERDQGVQDRDPFEGWNEDDEGDEAAATVARHSSGNRRPGASDKDVSEIYCGLYLQGGSAMSRTAKLFMNGRSQAVRLPAEFRFDATEVFIRRDPETGDVILSRRPDTWDGFFEALAKADFPENFLDPEERNQGVNDRDPFADWRE